MGWLRKLRWLGDAVTAGEIAWAISGFIRVWAIGETSVNDWLSFSPGFAMQVYAGLAVGGVVFLACLHGDWIVAWRRRHMTRLMALGNDLQKGILKEYGPIRQPAIDNHIIRSIVRKLDQLKIPHPSLLDSRELWDVFLSRLAGEAKAGAVKESRHVWKEMQDETDA